MIKFLIKIPLRLIAWLRLLFECLTFAINKPKNWEKLNNEIDWTLAFNSDQFAFNKIINQFPYKPDPWEGIRDYSFPIKYPWYFFKKLPHGRDCDDWSRVWSAYLRYRGYKCEEWIITTTNHPFTKSHFIVLWYNEDGVTLINYRLKGTYSNAKDALHGVTESSSTYTDKNMVSVRYKTWKSSSEYKNYVNQAIEDYDYLD